MANLNGRLADTEERAQIIDMILNDSDAVCEGCGANPREAGADGSPAAFTVDREAGLGGWFLDATLVPDPGCAGEMLVAQVRCPKCW